MVAPAMERAMAACRAAHASSPWTVLARQRLHAATVGGSSLLALVEERAQAATLKAAELVVATLARCQGVRGMK